MGHNPKESMTQMGLSSAHVEHTIVLVISHGSTCIRIAQQRYTPEASKVLQTPPKVKVLEQTTMVMSQTLR